MSDCHGLDTSESPGRKDNAREGSTSTCFAHQAHRCICKYPSSVLCVCVAGPAKATKPRRAPTRLADSNQQPITAFSRNHKQTVRPVIQKDGKARSPAKGKQMTSLSQWC